MLNSMKDIKGRIAELSAKGHAVYDEAGQDLDFSKVKSLEGDTTAKIQGLKAINDELTDLNKKYTELNSLSEARKAMDAAVGLNSEPEAKNNPAEIKGQKSIGEMIKGSGLFQNKQKSLFLADVDMKTLFETTAGWAPAITRLPGYVGYPVRSPSVLNFIPQYTTNQNSIQYMLETTYTAGNTVEKAEGAALGEAAFALTATSDEVEKIGAYVPVTDVQLEDEPSVGQYLTDRLTLQIKNRIEAQCLEGNGATPNLLGTLSVGTLQTQAKGADPTPDAVFKALNLVRTVGFAEPSIIFMNPTDWQDIRLLRTADGIYIYGSPIDASTERMWGVPMCITTAVTANTAIVGDYANYAAFYWRKGLEVAISNGYSTYFTEGKQAVRITTRGSMVHTRGVAFCKITGI
jgi:HK97 family phage major capsid protein